MRKAKKKTYAELLELAKAQTKRRKEDGAFIEEDLIANLAALIEIDVEAEKVRIAKDILDRTTKPGSTVPTGQLHLPGFGTYDYEPERMVRDDNAGIIEQDRTNDKFKAAESERAAKHLMEAAVWANRKRKEYELFASWIIEEQKLGHKDLTFGRFVREAGVFEERAAEQSEDESEE